MPLLKDDEREGGGNGDYTRIPEGRSHVAICDMVVDMGMQKVVYEGKESQRRKYVIRWHVPTVTYEYDGREIACDVSRTYNFSANPEANLRKDLEAWGVWEECQVPDPENPEKTCLNPYLLLGKPALISVAHNQGTDRIWVNLQSIAPLIEGLAAREPINELLKFSAEDAAAWDDASLIRDWPMLPEWLRKKIDYTPAVKAEVVVDEDDIPF